MTSLRQVAYKQIFLEQVALISMAEVKEIPILPCQVDGGSWNIRGVEGVQSDSSNPS